MLFHPFLIGMLLPAFASGHGYMSEPASRNWYTHTHGLEWGSSDGVPSKEYCPHCLNRNTGVCGLSESGINYDNWKDSKGVEMPWIPQAVYSRGQVVTVFTTLTAHHGGHMELRGCPDGKASTQACFDSHVFEFIDDPAFDMPKDPNHPERGYYWGGQTQWGTDFAMRFKIPDSLVGENVMFQWLYVTSNSCKPDGYDSYFGGNNSLGNPLDDSFWSANVPPCTDSGAEFMPMASGEMPGLFGEQFVNCAEVAILDGPTTPPVATPTNPPVVTNPPTTAPPTKAPTTEAPSGAPTTTDDDGPNPTAPPGSFCCSSNFKDCNVSGWCGESQSRCENECGASWIEVGSCSTGIALWGECTDSPASCCAPATCQGDVWYKQCV